MRITLLLSFLAFTCSAPVIARQQLPTVWILATGGTIAGQGSSSTDLSNYKPGSILGEQLVKAVPQIAEIADVRVEQIVNIPSHDITTANSADGPLNLLNAVKTAMSPDARGRGALIVMNDEIGSARDTTKTNTLR